MFAVRLPMTDTDAATTMDKIVTQIKTRFKVSTIVPPHFGHKTLSLHQLPFLRVCF